MRQWENSRWNHIFTYVFHLALHRSGALSSCPVGLIPSCFIDASLCFQLTWYQHLVSQSYSRAYQRDRQRGTNQFGGMQAQVELSASVCVCVCVLLYSVVGWTRWSKEIERFGWVSGKEVKATVPTVGNNNGMLWDKMLKFSSKCVRRWSNTRRHDGVGVIALLKLYSKTNTQ